MIQETAGAVAEDVNVSLSVRSTTGELVDGEAVDLGSVASQSTVTFGTTGNSDEVGPVPTDGEYDITVEVQFASGDVIRTTKTVTVAESSAADPIERALQRFDDGDGTIDRNEAVSAIVSYNTGSTVGGEEVTRNQAVQAIIAYNTGEPIET